MSSSSRTPPKGRPTPSRSQQTRAVGVRERYGVKLQWAAIALILVLVVVAILLFSDPSPGTHSG